MILILVGDSDFLHLVFLCSLSYIPYLQIIVLVDHQSLLSRLFQIEATKLLANIKFALIEMTKKSTNWCWEKLARKNLIQIFKRGKVVFLTLFLSHHHPHQSLRFLKKLLEFTQFRHFQSQLQLDASNI